MLSVYSSIPLVPGIAPAWPITGAGSGRGDQSLANEHQPRSSAWNIRDYFLSTTKEQV